MNINEKAAYLQGLLDGMKLDTANPENKLLTQIVSILSDIAEVIEDIKEETENIGEIVNDLDSALEDLEEFVYDNYDDETEEFGEYESIAEFECPKCGEMITFDDSDDPSDIHCGNCGEHIDFGLEDDDELESDLDL